MDKEFDTLQLEKIIDQALVYQCACPAQVCQAILDLRKLHDYQVKCVNDPQGDDLIHTTIAIAAEKTHTLMEDCLKEVLRIEGWDLITLKMPESLRKEASKT